MGYWPSLFGQDGWILASFLFLWVYRRVYGARLHLGTPRWTWVSYNFAACKTKTLQLLRIEYYVLTKESLSRQLKAERWFFSCPTSRQIGFAMAAYQSLTYISRATSGTWEMEETFSARSTKKSNEHVEAAKCCSLILVTKTMKRVIRFLLLCYLAEVTGKIHVEVRLGAS